MATAHSVGTFDYVIFGATGDLTMRKLLPAFYQRLLAGQVPEDSRIIGTARSKLSDEEYRGRARTALERFLPKENYDKDRVERFLGMIHYASVNGAEAESTWDNLVPLLADAPADRIRVFYLATAPDLFERICANLHARGLVNDASRVVLEKPIGTDQDSARAINEGVGKFFPEKSIFRIDHYIGKETVQDLIALRFANPILERLWNKDAIASIQITAAETVGLEGRGSYYDGSGALRDMIQNHLLQVLCLVAMEPPASLEADELRDRKVEALRALRPITDPKAVTVRGQYAAGKLTGESVPGYVEELERPSDTETYVAIEAEFENARWSGVPFYLRTGKRLASKVSEVVVTFKPAETSLFPDSPAPNRLVIRIQPNEGLEIGLNVKDPTLDTFGLAHVKTDVNFVEALGTRYPDAYERLLLDAARGDPVLFIRRDEVEAAWGWVTPVLDAWAKGEVPMSSYPAGSWGPDAAEALLARRGQAWHETAAKQG